RAENVRRSKAWEHGARFQRDKTHCTANHLYAGDNLRICKDGKRACRTCERRYSAEHRQRQRLLAEPKPPRAPRLTCRSGHSYALVAIADAGFEDIEPEPDPEISESPPPQRKTRSARASEVTETA